MAHQAECPPGPEAPSLAPAYRHPQPARNTHSSRQPMDAYTAIKGMYGGYGKRHYTLLTQTKSNNVKDEFHLLEIIPPGDVLDSIFQYGCGTSVIWLSGPYVHNTCQSKCIIIGQLHFGRGEVSPGSIPSSPRSSAGGWSARSCRPPESNIIDYVSIRHHDPLGVSVARPYLGIPRAPRPRPHSAFLRIQLKTFNK